MLKLSSKGISHILIPLIVVVVGVAAFGTYKLVDSSAASKRCDVVVGNPSVLYAQSGGGFDAFTRAYVRNCNFSGAKLTNNSISFCKVNSRTNPRDHGPCYKNKSAKSVGQSSQGKAYDLRLLVGGKRQAPKALRVVVITDPGDRHHYDFVTLRQPN